MARVSDFEAGQRVGAVAMNLLVRALVHPLADAAERDALTADETYLGMLIQLLDTGALQRWDGAAWVGFGGGVSTGGFTFGTTITWTWDSNSIRVISPHGLARTPDGTLTALVCLVADKGYPVGAVIPDIHIPWRVTVYVTATDVVIQPSNSTNRFGIATLGSGPGAGTDFTDQSWQYRIYPYTVDALDP